MPTPDGIFTPQESLDILCRHEGIATLLPQVFSREHVILDLGCGPGHSCSQLAQDGFHVIGFEGTPSPESWASFSPIFTINLTQPWWKILPQGQVLCIEVGEHIPSQYESVLLDNICQLTAPGCHSLVSWAVEGQEGCGHVNCRNNDYVIEQMAIRGLEFQADRTGTLRKDFYDIYQNTLMLFYRPFTIEG